MLLARVSIIALLAPSTHAVRSLRSSHFGIPGQDASFDYVGLCSFIQLGRLVR